MNTPLRLAQSCKRFAELYPHHPAVDTYGHWRVLLDADAPLDHIEYARAAFEVEDPEWEEFEILAAGGVVFCAANEGVVECAGRILAVIAAME
jgi:hypothetical protein